MSLAAFAALESSVNAAVFTRLANARVSIDGAAEFGGIFDNGFATGNVGPLGIGSCAPTVLVPSAQVPPAPVGLAIAIDDVIYTIALDEPDGAGGTRLALELRPQEPLP